MTPLAQLLIIITCALFVVAYLEYRHERAMDALVARLTLPPALPRVELPAPLTPRQILGFDNARHMPFLLERQLVRVLDIQPTRRMKHPIHPRFEAFGVDVSIHPTIVVDSGFSAR